MRNILLALAILIVSFLVITGYTDSAAKKNGDHVWKEQTDTIIKAAEVNQLIEDAATKHRQQLERQLQQ